MADLAKPVTFPGRRLFRPEGLLRATAIKAALLLGLVVYGTGSQSSVRSPRRVRPKAQKRALTCCCT